MRFLREPDHDAALQFLKAETGAARGHMVQVVADCEVRYVGRARSDLSRGERLIVLKPDGVLLVHSHAGTQPVNWQPAGAAVSVSAEGGHIVLTAARTKPEEMVRLTFHRIEMLAAFTLRDGANLDLLGSEDDLQQLLFEHPELVEPGFRPLRRERDTARGFYDLDGTGADGRRLIVEAKRATGGTNDAQQLWRYVERERRTQPSVRGILVAPKVSEKARAILTENGLEWKELEWSDILPQVEAMRHTGQASLGRFG